MKKENVKQEVIKKLKDLRKFRISWIDEVHKSMEVEAESEEEAERLFFSGELDFDKEEEDDSEYCEDSLEVVEDG